MKFRYLIKVSIGLTRSTNGRLKEDTVLQTCQGLLKDLSTGLSTDLSPGRRPRRTKLGLFAVAIAVALGPMMAQPLNASTTETQRAFASKSTSSLAAKSSGTLYAQKRKKSSGSKRKGSRSKQLVREKSTRGDSTYVDFEDTSITGQRRTPLGLGIDSRGADKDYDFVKIRKQWHPELIQSAKSLDTGD